MRSFREILFGSRGSIAGTVYGTIVVMGAIAAGAGSDGRPGRLAGIVAGTVLVLWIAHVYAHALGETIQLGRRLDWAELLSVARRELATCWNGPAASPVTCWNGPSAGPAASVRAVGAEGSF